MFYSETLLAKTGPLARVWLAANVERKLTKQNVLSSNLEDNVKTIIAPGQAPMALRLSGQLLLGVVKIYSRKARYLLDDCNDALNKIKAAFRPGNVDLAHDQTHTANPNALILPDALTELDLFAPLPDPEDLFRDDYDRRASGRDPTLLDGGNSQMLSQTQTPRKERRRLMEELDVDLDFGEEVVAATPRTGERSIEIGRRAETPLGGNEITFLDNDIDGLDYGLEEGNTTLGYGGAAQQPLADDVPMLETGGDDLVNGDLNDKIAADNARAFSNVEAAAERRQRESASPLSELGPEAERDLEQTFRLDQEQLEQDETMVQAAQRVKRRKVMRQDNETQLHNSQIKRQQEDRSAITKAPTFLPRDPLLLQLMEMQRNGTFVSNIMGDGHMAGWAPELRGILSLEVVRRAGERKRKRDSGVADLDVDTEGERQTTPQLELPDDIDADFPAGPGADIDQTRFSNGAAPLFSDPIQPMGDEPAYAPPTPEPFDRTDIPLLHPSQSGPVSLGTKTAVHLLRQHFAPDHPKTSNEPPTPSKRTKTEAFFTDLCPEGRTSRQDATKMFFEMLVLGTKDAVKVEQENGEVGLPIRVRGKRGLWGDWAEMENGIRSEESVVAA